MGDVTTLLRDAVPVEPIEPDIPAVAARARSRRRRRGLVRAAASLVVVLGVGASAAAALGADPAVRVYEAAAGSDDTAGQADRNGAGVGDDAQDRAARASAEPPMPDGSAFTTWLGSRPWVQDADLAWPVEPHEFFNVRRPDVVVVGTLMEVRESSSGDRPICMYVRDCITTSSVETVVAVERVLGDATGPTGEVAVPWALGWERSGPEDPTAAAQAALETDLSILALEESAPIGAQVLVFLVDDGNGGWVPIEPSGIVVDDPDGVAIAQPNRDAADLATSFDDYVARVEAILAGD